MISRVKSRDEKLDELLAKDDIHELLMRYSRGCDRADEEELRSVFHPDANLDYGGFKGAPGEFASWATKIHLDHFVSTSHFLGNSLIEVDGGNARGETYVTAWMRSLRDGKLHDMVFASRYVDRFEKRNGIWKISERVVVFDRVRIEEDVAAGDNSLSADLVEGLRNREDISYRAVGSTPG